MKKTLITLALAATVTSGSAMAWTASGAGGHIELSGTLSPVVKTTPWEVMTGSGLANLVAEVQEGQKMTEIEVTKAVPVLGIRTKDKNLFIGRAGFSPQIDFDGTVDLDKVNRGISTLTLDVKGMDDNKIGTLTAPFTMVGVGYENSEGINKGKHLLYSPSSGMGFFGGLPKNRTHLLPTDGSEAVANALIPGISDNFHEQHFPVSGTGTADFTSSDAGYSAYYASGITGGSKIKLELDSLLSESTEWKASLPITVTYM
ncbi:fimbrial protein [Erwinia piriflorinigrans]|nr:fimbrial protein [Erwinia piriflorinigrans]